MLGIGCASTVSRQQDLLTGAERGAACLGNLFDFGSDTLVGSHQLQGRKRLRDFFPNVLPHLNLHAMAPWSENCTVIGSTCWRRSTRKTLGRRRGSTTN